MQTLLNHSILNIKEKTIHLGLTVIDLAYKITPSLLQTEYKMVKNFCHTVCPRRLDTHHIVTNYLYEIGQDFLDMQYNTSYMSRIF